MAFLQPFEYFTWVCLLGSYAFVVVVMYYFSHMEKSIVPEGELSGWYKLKDVAWNCFGTALGESVYRYTRSNGAWGLRYTLTKVYL